MPVAAQLGLPMEKAQYVHRLGRTARAGKSGKGLIILGDYESNFLNSLSDLPITAAPSPSPQVFAGAQEAVEAGLAAVAYASKAQVRNHCHHPGSLSLASYHRRTYIARHSVVKTLCCEEQLSRSVTKVGHACAGRLTGPGWASTRASARCASGTQRVSSRLPISMQSLWVRRFLLHIIQCRIVDMSSLKDCSVPVTDCCADS